MVTSTTPKTTTIWAQRILVADMATKDQVLSTVIDKSYILPGVQAASAAYNLDNELRLRMLVANLERLGLRSIRNPFRRRTMIDLRGGGRLRLYEPRHSRPHNRRHEQVPKPFAHRRIAAAAQ
jgi:hypothetical protein